MSITEVLPVQVRRNFKSDKLLVNQILDLTRVSYINNTELIEREINHNQDIYILLNASEELLAFFMVNPELLAGEETYYLGLSACRDDMKGRGFGKTLYQYFLSDCRERERLRGSKYLLWWTTATPIVYYWFNKYVAGVQPDMEGKYTDEGRQIAVRIIREKYPELQIDRLHPFILRSVASNTSYSKAEHDRLTLASENLGLDVFQRFNMKEENADRFLMFGYTPER